MISSQHFYHFVLFILVGRNKNEKGWQKKTEDYNMDTMNHGKKLELRVSWQLNNTPYKKE